MSGPRITDAAVEAGARALWMHRNLSSMDEADTDDAGYEARDEYDCCAREALTAALPHLRRAVIEELIEKLDSEIGSLASQLADEFDYGAAYSLGEEMDDLRRVRDLLRAELEGDGE